MSSQAEWTWLVYMAGDNNLEGAGREDLDEMKNVGSTAQVNILVQFDTEENKTTRYRIEKDKLTVLQELPVCL
jgi:predicted RNA-binding protein with PIN domain